MTTHRRSTAPDFVIPGEFERSREITFTGSDVTVRVAGFKASPDGLFVTLTTLGKTATIDPRLGFASSPDETDENRPGLWLSDGSLLVASEIQRGAVRHPQTPNAPGLASFDLYFPIDVPRLASSVELILQWPGVLPSTQAVTVTAQELRDAAQRALA